MEAVNKWLRHRAECCKRARPPASGSIDGLVGSTSVPAVRCGVPSLMSGRLPAHPYPPPPTREMDPYRSNQHPYRPYTQPPSRRNMSPSGSRDPHGRHLRTVDGGSNIRTETRENKEKANDGKDQKDANVDADDDPDADADGDLESDPEAHQMRVDPPTSHTPPLGHIPNTDRKEANSKPVTTSSSIISQHAARSSSSSSVAPQDPSAPSVDDGSQPIIYSPAAGIFPPGPAHESRRRNAEQRAATLRDDPLIKHVEPNRVFCSLCEKWVQLRQDSSYCAYPWFQHRGKCMAR